MNKNRALLTGKRFGRLTAIKDVGSQNWKRMWLCKCDCGGEKVVTCGNLNSGIIQSCGCLQRETRGKSRRIHGLTRSREYARWQAMLRRCFDPTHESFKDYGGRGITVCDRWKSSVVAYLEDIGQMPGENYSVDRIDNNANYSCGKCQECTDNGWTMNCRWATREQQSRNARSNRMFTINGKTRCLTAWCTQYSVPVTTAWHRLKRHLTIEESLGIPPAGTLSWEE